MRGSLKKSGASWCSVLWGSAYLVTFDETGPLHILDLSDPTDPLIAGELNVLEFSGFLHPVSDNLLLDLVAGYYPIFL